jgi:hypothetical protein
MDETYSFTTINTSDPLYSQLIEINGINVENNRSLNRSLNTNISVEDQIKLTRRLQSINTGNVSEIYELASREVNILNQFAYNAANVDYINAKTVAKYCNDAAYSGYLITEAYEILSSNIASYSTITAIGNIPLHTVDPHILYTASTNLGISKQTSQNLINTSYTNLNNNINVTQMILSSIIIKSSHITNNLFVTRSINTLIKDISKIIQGPVSRIGGNINLIYQFQPGSPLLTSIMVVNDTISYMSSFVSRLKYPTIVDISTPTNQLSTIFQNLDSNLTIARDSLYLQKAVNNQLLDTAFRFQTLDTLSPGFLLDISTNEEYDTRLVSEITAVTNNAANILKTVLSIENIYSSTFISEKQTLDTAISFVTTFSSIVAPINTFIGNRSANSQSKTIQSISNKLTLAIRNATDNETTLFSAYSNADSVLKLLSTAYNINVNTSNASTIQHKNLVLNSLRDVSNNIANDLKKSLEYKRNNTQNVTPYNIAMATLYSFNNVIKDPSLPPPNSRPNLLPYKHFTADITARTLPPTMPNIDNLIEQNKIYSLTTNSDNNTVNEISNNINQQVHKLSNNSAFSYKK